MRLFRSISLGLSRTYHLVTHALRDFHHARSFSQSKSGRGGILRLYQYLSFLHLLKHQPPRHELGIPPRYPTLSA